MNRLHETARTIVNRAAELARTSSERPRRILIVDDEESVRSFAEQTLRGAGYIAETASDGDEALALVDSGRSFDLVVTDEIMPNMHGHELARRLRTRDPDIAILYLTGFSDRLFSEKDLLWEGEAYLDKPCSVEGLLEAVSMALFNGASVERRVRDGLRRLQKAHLST